MEEWMRTRLGPAATFERVREQLPILLDTLPELAQRALQRLSRPDDAGAQQKVLEELRDEIRDGQRRNRRLVIGGTLILSAVLIYALDGYRPVLLFNAPPLTWLLGGLGLWIWRPPRGSR
jgi:ubiquinone biosynthesis protein